MTDRRPSLQDFRFAAAGFSYLGLRQRGAKRAWRTADGDELDLFLIPLPPDLPRDARVWRHYRHFFQAFLEGSNGTVLDCAIREVGGCPAIATVYAVPQPEHGLAYVGTITVPFAEFSFVCKCHAAGKAAGGLKEAMLRSRGVSAADFANPVHDAEFPDHPLARVRRIVSTVLATSAIAEEIAALPRFPLVLKAE